MGARTLNLGDSVFLYTGPPLIKTQSIIQIATNKNCLKYSFMPRTVIDWNSIPLHIKEIEDKDKFKGVLHPSTKISMFC